ncbi:3-hydroxyacyl-CoA dehydrogenase family protein [Rubrobacter indicoceani]|uniref:3-hydroxyacyl-CoA dehydrogenase family protein n=1 Tax=Rubrobacter indicoceani TaxID=2051957 RepID=UPI00196950D2|nr:3-hydroxyacyl-CoA dehydrogenase family protein [Rubrobacter indicoceani]
MAEPEIENIKNILVVGAGAMGSQIGLVCAMAGYAVAVQDISSEMLEKAQKQLAGRMDRNVEKERMTRQEADEALARLTFTTDLEDAAKDADFVIEAAVEKLDIKRELFRKLDEITPDHTILATNSSTIESSRVADATDRPDRVCNMHFFNPALVMKCVEVVRNPGTSDATIEATVALTEKINKSPVLLNREIPGFVANRILHALANEAISLYENDVASFKDIDTACRTALGHPMGPFELMDLTGIDIAHDVRMVKYERSGDENDRPKRSIVERYERGDLGRKTGKGWYTYDEAGKRVSP